MATNKQVDQIYMGAYVYTGGTYKAFPNYPTTFKVWNATIEERADYLGSPTTTTLAGFQRGNPMGFRSYATINLNNSYPSESSKILSLLNLFASQYKRTFLDTTITAVSSPQVTIVGGVATADYYNGMLLFNESTSQTRTIIDYTSGGVATLDSAFSGWANGNDVLIQVPPSIPTVIGITVDGTNSNYMYFNLNGSVYGIQRELTIGTQMITLDLVGLHRKSFMADNVRIGT